MPGADGSRDVLRTPEAGGMVIRGGAVRAGGYALSVLLAAATSVFLLRYLGVEDFGRYGVVGALLGIVAALTEGGLAVVGSRDLAVLPPLERPRLLGNLVTLRLVLTAAGVLAAGVFALLAGYDGVVVAGTLLAGAGVVLLSLQVTMSLPLRVALRMGAVTSVEVLNQALTLVLVAILVAAGLPLLAFFGVQVAVGAVAVLVTAAFVGFRALRPRLEREVAVSFLRDALPIAAAVAMNVVYLRLLVVLVSLLEGPTETGLFATSFRIFEMLVGLPTLVLSIALPVLAVHVAADRPRFAYGFQRLTEIALLAGLFQAVLTAALAEPAIVLLFGEEYRDAAPMLMLQAVALVPVYLVQAWTLGLVALRRQRSVALANAVALAFVVVAGLVLVASFGGRGAAAAGVATESLLAALLLAVVVARDRDVLPALAFAWRPVAAALASVGVLLAAGTGWLQAALVAGVFAAVAVAVRAVPAELGAAFRARGGRP